MSIWEVRLLLVVAIVVLLLVIDSILIRRRVSTLERVAVGQEEVIRDLSKLLENTVKVHQERMDEHSAALRRLDEQTGKIAKRLFEHTDARIAHDQGRLSASVERIQKAQFWRNRGEGVLGVPANKAADEERPAEGLPPQ